MTKFVCLILCYISIILLASLASSDASSDYGLASAYGQCGGIGYTGPTCCVVAYECVKTNDWYSQCTPSTTRDPSCLDNALWSQCGGLQFNGSTCCPVGSTCVKQDNYYSQCKPTNESVTSATPTTTKVATITSKVSTTSKATTKSSSVTATTSKPSSSAQTTTKSSSVTLTTSKATTKPSSSVTTSQITTKSPSVTTKPLTTTTTSLTTPAGDCKNAYWGQCGGINFNGAKCCPLGSTCVRQDDYYSQCKPTNESVTTTTTKTTTVTTRSTSSRLSTTTTKGINQTTPLYSNILATNYDTTDIGSCSLPEGSYATNYPVALGSISSLGIYSWRPEMCGHILRINCGVTSLDIILVNSNIGGGLDLYTSTWKLATGNQPPGQAWCTVQLTNRNMLTTGSYQCYYEQGWQDYYHNVALFNTNERIVIGAKFGDGRVGAHRGGNPYYAFDGYASLNTTVTFQFEDGGTTYQVTLGDCISGVKKHYWS